MHGKIKVDGAKNAFLPIMAASVLCDGQIQLDNYVALSDLDWMREILKTLNIQTEAWQNFLYIDTKNIENNKISHELTQKVRASIFILGALLGRFRSAVIAYPGGCNIGTRPIDIHISAFKSLWVKIVERHGYIYCNAQNMRAGKVVFSSISVGATESVMMSAVLLNGKTTLYNVAREPEVKELADFLNAMGAKISGAGSDRIEIEGVKRLKGVSFKVFPDRIIAGTHLLLGAMLGKNMRVIGARREDNEILFNILKECGCSLEEDEMGATISSNGKYNAYRFIETLPYPNFPTDLQPQFMAFQTLGKGTSVIKENLFENRFNHVMELVKMGADIFVKDRLAIVNGVDKLYGADVFASDLRAGAGLVLAGLVAEGYTTISNIEYIDRGYERLEEKYARLGADIKRVNE